ncbi:MAG: TPM domain-containing protein [Bacteroidaceae bacterium]|nr:TPM domain-containing protein [Bacteroidaceae bacterium]
MRYIFFFYMSVMSALLLDAATYTPDNLPIPYLQDRTQYVSNPDGILSQEAVDSLNKWMGLMESTHGVQTVLAVVEYVEGGDVYEFCMALGRKYGIGDKEKNTGLIILLSTGDRAYYILTGRGLEGTLPDAICKRIENTQMLPSLREGDWDEAMLNTVRAITMYVDGDDSLVGKSDFDQEDKWVLIVFCAFMLLGIGLVAFGLWYDSYQKSLCPSCHKHSMKKISAYTDTKKKLGIRTHHDTYKCSNCQFTKLRTWDEAIAAAGGSGFWSGGGSGGFHSSGSFGGSFGGGSFGGGGAGGRF